MDPRIKPSIRVSNKSLQLFEYDERKREISLKYPKVETTCQEQ